MKDKFFLIASWGSENMAENAGGVRIARTGFACYVIITPGTPQYIHRLNLTATRGTVAAFGLIYQFLQFFTRFEVCDPLCRNINRAAGLRIPAFSRISLSHAKTPKSPKLDLLPAIECFSDAVEDDLDQCFGILLRHVGFVRNFFNKIRLCHVLLSMSDRRNSRRSISE